MTLLAIVSSLSSQAMFRAELLLGNALRLIAGQGVSSSASRSLSSRIPMEISHGAVSFGETSAPRVSVSGAEFHVPESRAGLRALES